MLTQNQQIAAVAHHLRHLLQEREAMLLQSFPDNIPDDFPVYEVCDDDGLNRAIASFLESVGRLDCQTSYAEVAA